jgi:hypothetical protein
MMGIFKKFKGVRLNLFKFILRLLGFLVSEASTNFQVFSSTLVA